MDIARIRKRAKGGGPPRPGAGRSADDAPEEARPASAPAAEAAAPDPPASGSGDFLDEDEPYAGAEEEKVDLLVCRLGTEEYAIRIEHVAEILKTRAVTRVPRTSGFVLGFTSMRGKMIPVVDVALRLTGKATGVERGGTIKLVVLRGPMGLIGAPLGDDVRFVSLPAGEFREGPGHLESPGAEYIEAVCPDGGVFAFVVSIGEILKFTASGEPE
jgi:purine-binding chemotaxis protein CheW